MSSSFPLHLFQPPASATKPPPLDLTADQQLKLKDIENHFTKDGFTLPVKEGAEERSSLGEVEMMYLSRETFLRFLTGCKGVTHDAIDRLEKTIVWRRTERIDDVEWMAADCGPESTTGKNMCMGFSNAGQPVIYFFPNRNITPVERRRPVHAVFMLERARDLMADGVTNTIVLFNFAGKRHGPPTSVSAARATLHILSHYYPENLGLGVFQNLPWVVKTFVNLMWPFVDPVTKHKTRFAGGPEDKTLFNGGELDPGQILKECGGTLDLPYDHEAYWPALIDVCLKRRQADKARWLALGPPKVGRSERDFKRLLSEEELMAVRSTSTSTPVDIETEIDTTPHDP